VTERILNPGELAEAGVGRKPMLKIAQIGTLYVEVLLPVEAYGKIKQGSAVEVLPEIPAGTRHRATIKVIDSVLDAASGTFGVRLELPNRDRKIPAGIRCQASFPDIVASKSPARRSAGAPPRSQSPSSTTAPTNGRQKLATQLLIYETATPVAHARHGDVVRRSRDGLLVQPGRELGAADVGGDSSAPQPNMPWCSAAPAMS
jgi:multidrug efflux pump subunit AcrA (membrane-fusion protein)